MRVPFLICLPMVARLLGCSSALHLVNHPNLHAQCTLKRAVDNELRAYGLGDGAEEKEFTQHLPNSACAAFDAGGGVDYVTFAHSTRNKSVTKEPLAVWVASYPRSGSSTILSMVSATIQDNQDGGDTFSLFEPCHSGDEFDASGHKYDCGAVLYDLAHCDFSHIRHLWGWDNKHSTNGHRDYSAKRAHKLCSSADVVAFKTVYWGHDLSNLTGFWKTMPKLKVIDVVRDPRSIYASWKATFEDHWAYNKYTIAQICGSYAKNLVFDDKRVHRIVFEDLLADPETATRKAYEFLGLSFGRKQKQWVQHVFNAIRCPGGTGKFSDCKEESETEEVNDKWRTELTEQELSSFRTNGDCQRVQEAYGFPE